MWITVLKVLYMLLNMTAALYHVPLIKSLMENKNVTISCQMNNTHDALALQSQKQQSINLV